MGLAQGRTWGFTGLEIVGPIQCFESSTAIGHRFREMVFDSSNRNTQFSCDVPIRFMLELEHNEHGSTLCRQFIDRAQLDSYRRFASNAVSASGVEAGTVSA